ncbi:SRPBCC family protein [Parahaliea sp. F7430]|uniref:SRPBCC family protein n=1 Tax=Sediminihaliea albiluteola TaxID=2758564 RepID=A0A7W2TWD1_9GAMM|nr:SRPBCC family protein [Sediminihaliea albiluteola]MBA6413139.1 SRPBCC family protein [Sediminihaliea albiluteola]
MINKYALEDRAIHSFTVEKTLAAARQQVWAVVSDFSNLGWFEAAERVEQVGEGVGQIRRIYMPGMDQAVEEKLLAIDEASYSYEYEVLPGAMNVMRDYRVVATLGDAGEGRTQMRLECSFSGVTADGVAPEDMIALMQDTYDAMLDAIAAEALSRA